MIAKGRIHKEAMSRHSRRATRNMLIFGRCLSNHIDMLQGVLVHPRLLLFGSPMKKGDDKMIILNLFLFGLSVQVS